jgi:peroxiredoxin Q/BCP
MKWFVSRVLVALAMLGLALPMAAEDGALSVGDQAPLFKLPGSDGATYSLSDFRGKQVVVLAWFPKAFTGG